MEFVFNFALFFYNFNFWEGDIRENTTKLIVHLAMVSNLPLVQVSLHPFLSPGI